MSLSEEQLAMKQRHERKRARRKALSGTTKQMRKAECSRKWHQANPEKALLKAQAWRDKNPEKAKAHYLVKLAVRYGRLKEKPCEVCGARRSDAHHDDYSKPLEVRWLCREHHKKHHSKLLIQNVISKDALTLLVK